MNLVQFIDNRFQELRLLEEQETKDKAYSVTRDAEVMALQAVLKAYRTLIKIIMVPKVLGHYIAVMCGTAKKPEPVLLDRLKKQMDEKKATESALLDKVEKTSL